MAEDATAVEVAGTVEEETSLKRKSMECPTASRRFFVVQNSAPFQAGKQAEMSGARGDRRTDLTRE
ncbi:hypothetical protein GA0061105_108170 [Rhizobium aethiopicum]|uniref:Uncharacterized protein n=1 Tax=Rhizobium aethiopicum TaxID=1138170 RepID=A0A1C3Y5W7_9HYPH|nr:hypothetical protein GA0061105_108170 [Rhizobium aethiopicum]